MVARIIYCAAVSLAVIAVMLLALFSPLPDRHSKENAGRPSLALSFYIQQPKIGGSNLHPVASSDAGALIFHRTLTEGPENTSMVVGKAQGFIIPIDHFAHSAFNILYLTFNTRRHSGSLSIQAKDLAQKEKKELATVVGGTGSFAFVRGFAVFAQTDRQSSSPSSSSSLDATYHIRLHLKFPNRSQIIPG